MPSAWRRTKFALGARPLTRGATAHELVRLCARRSGTREQQLAPKIAVAMRRLASHAVCVCVRAGRVHRPYAQALAGSQLPSTRRPYVQARSCHARGGRAVRTVTNRLRWLSR